MADLTLTPDSVYEENVGFKTLISKFENGVEQRRAKWSTPIRKFRCEYRNRTEADYETIRDFLITKKGTLTSFTFANINDSVEYTVRFEDDEINFQRVAYDVYNFGFTLIQVK